MLEQGIRYGRYLLWRLALPENDLWKALADGPVMVNLGELQVLVRQVPEMGYYLILAKAVALEAL